MKTNEEIVDIIRDWYSDRVGPVPVAKLYATIQMVNEEQLWDRMEDYKEVEQDG